jgi:hypothetical protein
LKVELTFGIADTPTHKVVSFLEIDIKKAYVDAEQRDPACKKAFFSLRNVKTAEESIEQKTQLGNARYAFYKRWALNNLSDKMMHSVDAPDDSYIPPDVV